MEVAVDWDDLTVRLLRMYLVDASRPRPWPRDTELPDIQAMHTFATHLLDTPEAVQLLALQQTVLTEVISSAALILSGAESRFRLLRVLLDAEFAGKFEKEKGSILRGNGLVDVLLVRVVKAEGTQYAKGLLSQVASELKGTADVVAMASQVLHVITSYQPVPPALCNVFHLLRQLCIRYDLPYRPLIGGLLLLRIVLPLLIQPQLYGVTSAHFVANVSTISSILQKIASHKVFQAGDESVKYNRFIEAHHSAFDAFFDRISEAPVPALEAAVLVTEGERRAAARAVCQLFYVQGHHLEGERAGEQAADLLARIGPCGNPFLGGTIVAAGKATKEMDALNFILETKRDLAAGSKNATTKAQADVRVAELLYEHVFLRNSGGGRQIQLVCSAEDAVSCLRRLLGLSYSEIDQCLDDLVKQDILNPVTVSGDSIVTPRVAATPRRSNATPGTPRSRSASFARESSCQYRLNKASLIRARAHVAGAKTKAIEDVIAEWAGADPDIGVDGKSKAIALAVDAWLN